MFGILAALIILISPENGVTVSNSTLTWQAVEGSIEYSVLVDDEPTVSSPYVKSSYPTNTSYTPQKLSPGTYFWKVKSKDSSGLWSDWSEIWSFNLDPSATPTPSPSTSPSPSPSPSASTQPSSPPKSTKSTSITRTTNPSSPSPTTSLPSNSPTQTVTTSTQTTKPLAQLPNLSSVSGVASQSSDEAIGKTEVAADTSVNWKRILGIVVLVFGLGAGLFIWKSL